MIAFVLTLMYTALTLLSPAVLPDAVVRLHAAEILGGLTIVATIFSLSGAGLASIPETYLAMGLVAATAFSTLATGWVGGVSGTVLGFLPIIFNFFFILISCRSLKRLKVMTSVLVLIAVFIIAQGLLAFQTNNLTSKYLEPEGVAGGVLYRFRGLGVLNDPNDLAQFLVMLLPLLWLRWKKGSFAANLLFTLLPAGVLLVGIYMTHSRGGILAVVAVLLFGMRYKVGLVPSAILAGGALAGLLALNVSGGRGMNEDDGGRVAAWRTGLEVFKSHPIFGVGVGNFGDYNYTGLTAHNSYVLCLAEIGLPGYFFWMGMIVSGWSGLTKMTMAGAQGSTAEEETEAAGGAPALRAPVRASYPARWGEDGSWEPGGGVAVEPAEETAEGEETGEQEFTFTAKVMRVSLVGLLTTSFFLSRTYSMTLYVLLGMSVALRALPRSTAPQLTLRLLRQISVTMAASVIFLYLFVRLSGLR